MGLVFLFSDSIIYVHKAGEDVEMGSLLEDVIADCDLMCPLQMGNIIPVNRKSRSPCAVLM